MGSVFSVHQSLAIAGSIYDKLEVSGIPQPVLFNFSKLMSVLLSSCLRHHQVPVEVVGFLTGENSTKSISLLVGRTQEMLLYSLAHHSPML